MARPFSGIRRWLSLLTVLAVVATACGGGSTRDPAESGTGPVSAEDPLHVVVSLPVFVSMVEAVGGDRVAVSSIVPAGADAHTYQPTPGDVRKIADARVIFVNGLGLEEWLQGLIESAGGSRVPVHELAQPEAASDATPTAGHDHAEGNPHQWLDPTHAVAYVHRIASVLSEEDPAGAEQYRANADRYAREIEAFDESAREQIATIPPERRKLVTYHDAFPYFAEHYGLALVGVVVTSPGRDPSPRDIAQLVDEVKAQGVPALFVEPQFNPNLAKGLAQEAGIKTYVLYSDSPPEGQGYLEMMRLNVEQVVEGLR